MVGSLFNKNIKIDLSSDSISYSISVVSFKYKNVANKNILLTNSTFPQNFNDYSTNKQQLKHTTVLAKNATGTFLSPGYDDLPHY